MELHIDNRERDLLGILCDLKLITSNLDLGDIIIKNGEITMAVFERKTWSDLAASLKDGRFVNQKRRLLEQYDTCKLYYIIEGPGDYSDVNSTSINGISKQALLSCVINMQIRDDIKVFRTNSLLDTGELIRGIWKRLSENPAKYMPDKQAYIPEEQIVKETVSTPEEFFLRALCQLPGVSKKTAKAITLKYPTLPNFIEQLAVVPPSEKLKLLKEITTIDSKGSQRKIAERVAKSLIEFILGSNVRSITI